jgi:hypothetical protein
MPRSARVDDMRHSAATAAGLVSSNVRYAALGVRSSPVMDPPAVSDDGVAYLVDRLRPLAGSRGVRRAGQVAGGCAMTVLLIGYGRCSSDQHDLTPQRDGLAA